MKKLLATLTALTMLLAMASCGGDGDNTSSETSSAPASSQPTSSAVTPPVSVPPVSVPEEVVVENLALDGTPFDHNEGLKNGDEGWYDYYERATATDSLAGNAFDGSTATGWQPMGTDGDEETLVTNEADREEGFYTVYKNAEGEEVAEGTEGATATTYFNALEDTELPENWYWTGDDHKAIREQATYEDGKVYAGVTFEEAVKADCIVLLWEAGSVAETYENGGFYLEYTADGETWEKLDVTVERGESDGTSIADTATFEAVEATGYRVVSLKCTNKWGSKLWEMEIYAPEEAEEGGEATESDASTEDTLAE